jgi:hypothetical protein
MFDQQIENNMAVRMSADSYAAAYIFIPFSFFFVFPAAIYPLTA